MAGLTPDEIYTGLRRLPSLGRLEDEEVLAIANVAEWQIIGAGEALYRIGRSPDRLYILETGLIRLQRPDPRTGARTRERVDPGDVFGVESLSTSRQIYRDDAVADEESAVFSVGGQALTDLLQKYPRIRRLGRSFRVRMWQMRIRLPDRQPNETILVARRQHWSMLVERLALPLLILLAAIAVSGGLAVIQVSLFSWIAIGLSLLTAAMLLLGWSFADWWSDQYIVTNQRVIAQTVRPYIRERQREAPIERVVNTTVNVPTPWAAWLGWSDVIIGTSGMQPIKFERISDGAYVAAVVNERLAEARQRAEQATRGERQKYIRDSLQEVMDPLATPPPQKPPVPSPNVRRGNPMAGAYRYFWPKIRDEQGSTIVYRKHRIVMVRDTILWLLALLVVAALEAVAFAYFYPLPVWVDLIGVVALVVVLARLMWVYDDWRIDIYILTERTVIDVQRRPFYLSEKRQTAALDNLQDVTYTIPSPIARFFNYGDIVMETAGSSGRQSWSFVSDPRNVQNEIIRRMETSRRMKAESERRSREAEIKEWIGEYHKIQQGGAPPPQPPPTPPPP
ncbi:MAG: cyclic nucleotide-binding domain-containing protein [Anaerolineae bacterium]